jgi:putative membrane protein
MFVKSIHEGNLAEIAAGNDAQQHAATTCVKTVGSVLVRDHSKLDTDLKALAGKLGTELSATPTAAQQQDLDSVRARAGTAYDSAWLKVQDDAHVKALALIDKEISSGRSTKVRAAAKAARPVVAMHLDMVRGGTCHASKDAGTVRAGTGGYLAAPTPDTYRTLGAVSLAVGGLLAAIGAACMVRSRRRTAKKR